MESAARLNQQSTHIHDKRRVVVAAKQQSLTVSTLRKSSSVAYGKHASKKVLADTYRLPIRHGGDKGSGFGKFIIDIMFTNH